MKLSRIFPIATLTLVAIGPASTCFAQEAPALQQAPPSPGTERPIVFDEGSFRQGGHRLAVDDRGTLHLLSGNSPVLTGIAIEGRHEERDWQLGPTEGFSVERNEGGLLVVGSHPSGAPDYTITARPDGQDMIIRVERRGGLPTETCEDVLRFGLPISYFLNSSFYTERITLPYEDRTFDDPMLINGFKDFRANPSNDLLDFAVKSESLMRIDHAWQQRLPIYRLDVPLPAGEEVSVEVRLTFPPSDTTTLDPAIRYPLIGYKTSSRKRAMVEWPKGTELTNTDIKVLSVDGTVAFEGKLGAPSPYLDKMVAEFDFTPLQARGVFVIRDEILPDSMWTPTLDRFLPWQMAHAEVDFAAALPPKRKSFMDDAVRAPDGPGSSGGFISHGQVGSLYAAGDTISSSIGGWFDGGTTHQSVPANAFIVWVMTLAQEQFAIDRDQATLNQMEQTYSAVKSDGVPDLTSQIEWGVWWLLQMQEPTGRVYSGVASQPDRDSVLIIPERMTDGEAGTGDERYVFVDYHPHMQLAQVIGLSAASRHLSESNPALSKRAAEAARGAFDYFSQQEEEYRPTVNFPHSAGDPAIAAGRDSMLAAAAAELYLATKDEALLTLLESLGDRIAAIQFDDPAPRWSTDSGFWYAGPSLARLFGELPEGDLKNAVSAYLNRAAMARKAELSGSPWPFAESDLKEHGVNGAAAAQIFDAYWLSRAKPELLSMDDALPALEWIVGSHPVSGRTFVTGIGYAAPTYLFNANIHGRVRNFQAVVPGAFMPGVGRLSGNSILVYADLPLRPQNHDARMPDQALWIFAVHAMRSAGF
jgi:hypothetical protein